MPQYRRSAQSICSAPIWAAGREQTRYSVSRPWAGLRGLSMQRVNRAACSTKGKPTVVAVVSKAIRQRASVRLRLSSQVCARDVWARGGKCARQALRELLHVVSDARLIAFDGEKEIGPSVLHDDTGRLGLGVQSVGRD